jgi:hypothetical protein
MGHFRFSFQDVVFLRAAKGLTDAAISVRQSNRALTKLKADLSQLESSSAVRIYANGSVVEVRDDDKAWEVESGQLTMNFLHSGAGCQRSRTGEVCCRRRGKSARRPRF